MEVDLPLRPRPTCADMQWSKFPQKLAHRITLFNNIRREDGKLVLHESVCVV